MSNEEDNSRPASQPSSEGSRPASGERPRRSRFRDESRPQPANGSNDYKPSDAAGGRTSSSERRPERERSGGGSGRSRPGSGRRLEPDGRRGGRAERSGGPGRRRSEDVASSKEASVDADDSQPTCETSFLDELGGELLASVSRSFALTIKALPVAMREPITAGYLLARAMDTVADTTGVPSEKRLEHLRALLEMVKCGPDPELLSPLQKDLTAKQTHEGEKNLIKQLGRCLAWLEALPPEDAWDLRRALFRIGRGQELDLLRFGAGDPTPKPLATVTELDEYTYFVAGCVGELWTRLSARHLAEGWSKLGPEEMMTLGKHFGQGLQMVNILRDLPEDLANGRCYLPETLLSEHGLTAEMLTTEAGRAKPILDNLRARTVAKLDDAWKYARALTPMKLRYACALPVLIGFETLGLLAKNSPLVTSERVKVPKSNMRGLMLSSAIGTAIGPWHERQYRSARARALK